MESGRGSFEEDFNAANLASVPPYEPLQTVPLTLAPFVLAPNAASALPNINIATPDANKFPQLSIPDSGFVIADDQLEAIKSGITNVMNTSPVFMSTKYVDTDQKSRFLQIGGLTNHFLFFQAGRSNLELSSG